jgi:serine/threonine-protein kinase RsbW
MPEVNRVVCAEDARPMAAPLVRSAADCSPVRWRRNFPGEARQVSVMRQWLRSVLPECPAQDDVLFVASELATNAVQHTRTGQDGWFGVEVVLHDRETILVAVADGGGPGTPAIADEAHREHGRGLRVVRALSACDGYCGGEEGRRVWAEIPWQGVPEARV